MVPRPRHVYVHVPFCARRCSYCDFSIAVRREVPVDEYLRALEHELQTRFSEVERSEVDTIYLGGGTPSRLGGEGRVRAVELVSRYFPPAAGAGVLGWRWERGSRVGRGVRGRLSRGGSVAHGGGVRALRGVELRQTRQAGASQLGLLVWRAICGCRAGRARFRRAVEAVERQA